MSGLFLSLGCVLSAAGPMEVEAFEAADAGPASMAVETFEPTATEAGPAAPAAAVSAPKVESFSSAPTGPTVRVYGSVKADTSVDTRFDSPRDVPMAENVAEARLGALLGVDVKLSPHLRLVLEGRARARFATQREFDRLKGFFEPMLGDAYLDLYTQAVDVRVGNQRIVLGANPMAPADALNPRDLRESFLSGDPDEGTLPVFAVRAQGEVGKVAWLAAYAPFFTPDRYAVFGQDEAILQPGLAPVFDARRVDATIEDSIQGQVLETKRPVPFAGDVAVRFTSVGAVKVGASFAWVNEKFPRVTMDPELSSALAARAAGKQVDPATAVSLLNRFEAGETLFTGEYRRQAIFSAEGSLLLGPGQLDVDLSYTPRQTFFDDRFRPIDKASGTVVLGYSQAEDSPWLWSLTYLGMVVPDVAAQEQLLFLEPATAVGAARTAFFHTFIGAAAWKVWKDRLELSFRGAVELIHGSFALAPRVTWQQVEGLKVWLTLELYQGPAWSPFGYYGRNDKVLLGARYELF